MVNITQAMVKIINPQSKRRIRNGWLTLSLIFFLMPICVYSNGYSSTNSPQVLDMPPTTYSDLFRLEAQATRFYVTSLEVNQSWWVNCTAQYKGIFYLFLFNTRPKSTYITQNRTIDSHIYTDAILYNITPSYIHSTTLNDTVASVSLNYTLNYIPTKKTMYYIEVILILNGPDTFYIESSKEIQVYFIPFIPGYPITALWILIGTTSMLVARKIWKKRKP